MPANTSPSQSEGEHETPTTAQTQTHKSTSQRERRRRTNEGDKGGPPGERRATATSYGYGTVILLIAGAYGLCAFQSAPRSNSLTLLLQLVTVGAIFYVAGVGKTLRRITYVVLAVAVALTLIAQLTAAAGQALDVTLCIAAIASYLVSPAVIIRQQLRRTKIDVQTLLAAICAYLLIGMFFTFVYNLMGLLIPTGIFGSIATNTLSAQTFFSFTSLTTTGFGNIVPVVAIGQTAAVAEAIVGQLFLVVAVARVVTGMVPSNKAAA